MSKRDDCYAHLRLRGSQVHMAREARKQRLRPLFLSSLDDLPSVRAAIVRVLDARSADRISERTSGLMLWGLQQAASCLKFEMAMAASAGNGAPPQERAQEYPNFEAEFGLPANFDLDQPPEVAFPPDPETVSEA